MSFKYTGPCRDAIVKSIEHWEEIQRLVETSPDKRQMLTELWVCGFVSADTCALCQYADDNDDCTPCPLAIEGNQCDGDDSSYTAVRLSVKTDDYTVSNAIAGMLAALKALLELEE